MEDPVTLLESLPQWYKQKGPSLHFNLASYDVKPYADSMTVEDRKWLESIHIIEDTLSINQNT